LTFIPTKSGIGKSGYVCQIYSCLRSQERGDDPLSLNAEGLMLHPAIDAGFDETVRIQGHDIRFVTIDLAKPTLEIIAKLRDIPKSTCGSMVKTLKSSMS
jgi:5-methylcytosine-specific restriction enzyme subunit McrC